MPDQMRPAGPTIWLRSSNNAIIGVEKAAAERSMVFKTLIEDLGDNHISEDNPIPVYNVNEEVLQKVMEWCDHHKNDPVSDGTDEEEVEISEWDATFLNSDQEMLFEILLAANYLDIGVLLDVGCKTVANMIKGKSPDEMRRILNVHNDFTEEEEEQIRRENEWAEEE